MKLIDRIRSLNPFKKNYEESVREFGVILEEEEQINKSLEVSSSLYFQTLQGLDDQIRRDSSLEFFKSQRSDVVSNYLQQIGEKKKEFDEVTIRKQFFLKKYPLIEESLKEIRKEDFLTKSLRNYRDGSINLDEYNMILKSLGKVRDKVEYADNLVFNLEGQLLIVQRAPLEKNGPDLWVLPGGHKDNGETFEEAAKRELQEETGYSVSDVVRVSKYEDDKCYIEYYYSVIDTSNQSPTVDSDEIRYSQFVDIKDLYKYPTMYNIWDNVYKILGIRNDIINIKKSLRDGILYGDKYENIGNEEIESSISTIIGENESVDKKILRSAITSELETINLYENLAKKSTSEKIERVLLDVIKEEKVHVGEFESLLKEIDQEQANSLIEGKEEVEEITKAAPQKHLGHLVPRKVQIKGASSKIYTGKSEKLAEGLKEKNRVEEDGFESMIEEIVTSEGTRADNTIANCIYTDNRDEIVPMEQIPEKALAEVLSGRKWDDEIIRGRRAKVGEIRTWKDNKKYQKQQDGKWIEVKSDELADFMSSLERDYINSFSNFDKNIFKRWFQNIPDQYKDNLCFTKAISCVTNNLPIHLVEHLSRVKIYMLDESFYKKESGGYWVGAFDEDKNEIHINRQEYDRVSSDYDGQESYLKVLLHEYGHRVYRSGFVNSDILFDLWESKERVSQQSKLDYEENFCEVFAAYLMCLDFEGDTEYNHEIEDFRELLPKSYEILKKLNYEKES